MTSITVATYNMSYMSDLSVPLDSKFGQSASEATFLTSNPNIETKDGRRKYWKNANKLLFRFMHDNVENQNTCIIGLQEMNLTPPNSGTGSDAINQSLARLNSKGDTKYMQICREFNVNDIVKPALSIIFDAHIFGNLKYYRMVDNWHWDLKQSGRPLLIVITDRNYVFVNIHGGQIPDDGDPTKGGDVKKFNQSNIKINKDFLEKEVEFCLTHQGYSKESPPKKIFIMGDFNDRYDAIEEFTILDKELKYNGDSPFSCCHNWDSSCSDGRFRRIYEFTGLNTEENNQKTDKHCEKPPDDFIKDKNEMKLKMTGDEGSIKNYRYKGDKIFGEINNDNDGIMKIYDFDNRKERNSTESDHELVYSRFTIPIKVEGEIQQQNILKTGIKYKYKNERKKDSIYSQMFDKGRKLTEIKQDPDDKSKYILMFEGYTPEYEFSETELHNFKPVENQEKEDNKEKSTSGGRKTRRKLRSKRSARCKTRR